MNKYLLMADNYSEVLASHYKAKIVSHKVYALRNDIVSAAAENAPNSILGAITVGLVKGIINMIINFVKYIAYTIQGLVQGMDILPKIIGGLMAIAESSRMYNIKITSPDVFVQGLNNIKKIVDRRNKHINEKINDYLNEGSSNLQKLELILDPEFIKHDYFDTKFVNKISTSNNDRDKINAIKYMKAHYKDSISKFNPNKSKAFVKSITCRDDADIKDNIRKYRMLLEEYQRTTNDLIDYLQNVIEKSEAINKQLKKLEDDPSSASLSDKLFIEYTNELMALIITEQKNLIESSNDIKNDIVINLLAISKKM